MPARRPSRSRATTSPAPPEDGAAARPASPRPHVVDRALAVHGLLAAGHPSAEVQRRLRVSKGYVSVLGYLGAALAGMEPEAVAQLRTPAVTARAVWPLATAARTAERAARRTAATAEGREQARRRAIVHLRAALRDHVLQDRVLGAPPGAPNTAHRTRAKGRRVADRSAAARAVGWAHAAWADDPVAFTHAHLAALAAAHGRVAERAARAVALAGAEHALAGQVAAAGEESLHRLGGPRWRALAAAARGARTPAEERALAALAVVTHKLREAHDEVARLGTAPTAATATTAAASGGQAAAGPPDPFDPVPWADVEDDLRD